MIATVSHQPQIVAAPHTDEWYAARKTGIGASQAGAACGLSKYSGPFEVYQVVRGETVIEENAAMRRGKHMEPAIRGMYQDEFNVTVEHDMPMYRHPQWDYMLATPDGQESPEVGVEFKDMNFNVFRQVDELGLIEAVPHYAVQCHQQIAVMGWQMVKLVIYSSCELHVFEVERDEEIIEMIAEREGALWQRIISGDPPEPTQPSDLELLRKLGVKEKDPVIPLTDEISNKWLEYEQLNKEIKELRNQQDILKAQVLNVIGERPGGLLSGGERVVQRKLTSRKGYTVEPSEYVAVRAVKYRDQPIEYVKQTSTESTPL